MSPHRGVLRRDNVGTFLPPDFAKRAEKERISDDDLVEAITRADAGLIDAQLGSGLIKQRLARRGQGRSGGFRTIIAYRRGTLAVFLHLFSKNAKATLTASETELYRTTARVLMTLGDKDLARLAAERGWRRLDDD